MAKSRCPIVFIHNGKQKYLEQTVHLAQKTNREVYLLGDESNKLVCENWISSEQLASEKYVYFRQLYRHMSDNPYEFELGCFRRFYLLEEFMKLEKLNRCIMVDSDLCIYTDLSEYDFENCECALSMPVQNTEYSWSYSAHCSLWTLCALQDFLNFLKRTYSTNIEKLEQKWKYHKDKKLMGGICDMTLLYLWTKSTNIVVCNLSKTLKGIVFDHNVSGGKNYAMNEFKCRTMLRRKRIKYISFRNSVPYFVTQGGDAIRAYTIHAQGGSKRYISCFCNYRNSYVVYFVTDVKYYIQTGYKKIFGKS